MNKLTPTTSALLKNFSSINKNLRVQKGNQLTTISEAKNILAVATVEEDFPQDFGIYDLNEFLGVFGLLEDPTLEFDSSSLVLSSGRSKVKYRFADESILTYPQKTLTMPTPDITVEINDSTLNQVRKAAGVLGHSTVSIKSEGKAIILSVVDAKNSTANAFDVVLEDNSGTDAVFDLQFLITNLKLIPGDYDVKLSSKLISHWKHQTEPVEYFIALEKTSTYEA
jgi:hypothetical protein